MKRLYLILAIGLLISLSACRNAEVSIGTDENNKVVINGAGGTTSPERGLSITRDQEETTTLAELEEQYRRAIKKKDWATAEIIQDLIDRKKNHLGGSSGLYRQGNNTPAQTIAIPTKQVKLGMTNPTKNGVTVLNGPFAGTTLTPGDKTVQNRPWPVGIFCLEYEVFPIGASYSFKRKANIAIKEGQTDPINFTE